MPKSKELNCIHFDWLSPASYYCHVPRCFSILKVLSHEEGWRGLEHTRRRLGSPAPPDSAPAPAEVLAGVRWRGEEEEEEGKERRRVSGSDRQQSWQQHFLRWAILNSLSYLLTPASKCSVGELGVWCYRWLYWAPETWNFWHANKLAWKSLKYEILHSFS